MNKETSTTPRDTSPEAILSQDIIMVDGHRVACNGGGGALGHPMIYLEMGTRPEVTCPYCSRRFVARK